jgi:hypothetical protein
MKAYGRRKEKPIKVLPGYVLFFHHEMPDLKKPKYPVYLERL